MYTKGNENLNNMDRSAEADGPGTWRNLYLSAQSRAATYLGDSLQPSVVRVLEPLQKNKVVWGTHGQGTQRVKVLLEHSTQTAEIQLGQLTWSESTSKPAPRPEPDTDEVVSNWAIMTLDQEHPSDIEDTSIHTNTAT